MLSWRRARVRAALGRVRFQEAVGRRRARGCWGWLWGRDRGREIAGPGRRRLAGKRRRQHAEAVLNQLSPRNLEYCDAAALTDQMRHLAPPSTGEELKTF